MVLDETIAVGQAGHIADHQDIHKWRNLTGVNDGVIYVSKAGDDANSGYSWGESKLTAAGARAQVGSGETVQFGSGGFDINESLSLLDGTMWQGISTHGFITPPFEFGTELQATAELGTDPMFTTSTISPT